MPVPAVIEEAVPMPEEVPEMKQRSYTIVAETGVFFLPEEVPEFSE